MKPLIRSGLPASGYQPSGKHPDLEIGSRYMGGRIGDHLAGGQGSHQQANANVEANQPEGAEGPAVEHHNAENHGHHAVEHHQPRHAAARPLGKGHDDGENTFDHEQNTEGQGQRQQCFAQVQQNVNTALQA